MLALGLLLLLVGVLLILSGVKGANPLATLSDVLTGKGL